MPISETARLIFNDAMRRRREANCAREGLDAGAATERDDLRRVSDMQSAPRGPGHEYDPGRKNRGDAQHRVPERTPSVEAVTASLRLELDAERYNHRKDNEHLLGRLDQAHQYAKNCERTMDAALEREERLREIVENYVEHGSWRCQYRTRYKQCCCGLDERLAALGLPPCGYDDPEAT